MSKAVIAVGLDSYLQSTLLETCSSQNIRLEHLTWVEWLDSRIHIRMSTEGRSLLLERNNAVSIQIDKAVGLISFDRTVPRAEWAQASQSDQSYLYSARQSAWLTMHAMMKRSINQLHHGMLQAHFLSLPHCYAVAAKVNISVPRWHFSSSGEHPFYFVCTGNTTLDSTHNFSKSYKPGLLSVEFIEGDPVLILAIGSGFLAIGADKERRCYRVPNKLKIKLQRLQKVLALDVVECFFKIRQGVWILQRISTRPEWIRWWRDNTKWVCEAILVVLEGKQQSNDIVVKKALFIDQRLRPNIGY